MFSLIQLKIVSGVGEDIMPFEFVVLEAMLMEMVMSIIKKICSLSGYY